MSGEPYYLLASAEFCLGVYGVLSQRRMPQILVSLVLMTNAAALQFVSMSTVPGTSASDVFAMFSMAFLALQIVLGFLLAYMIFPTRPKLEEKELEPEEPSTPSVDSSSKDPSSAGAEP